ncbi:uncharacterized protein V6R79_001318 [Siganus canaliculatus]
MGAKMVKGTNGKLTPVEVVLMHHPDHKKRIQKYMNKWHKRTTGKLKWPREGTFDSKCCDEVLTNIKHYKGNDYSDRREGKRAKQREVLEWFRQAGLRYQAQRQRQGQQSGQPARGNTHAPSQDKVEQNKNTRTHTPTAPHLTEEIEPPPYNTANSAPVSGLFPMLDTTSSREEQHMEGKFSVTFNPSLDIGARENTSRKKRSQPYDKRDDSSTDTEEGELTNMDQREYRRLNSWQSNQVEAEERREYARTVRGRKLSKNDFDVSCENLCFSHGSQAKTTSSRGRSRSPRDTPAERHPDDSPQLRMDLRRSRKTASSMRARSQENIRFTMEGVMHPTESSTPRRKPAKMDGGEKEQQLLLEGMQEVEERLTRRIDNSLRDAGNCLDQLLQNSRQEPEAAMTLRNGKQLSGFHEHQLNRHSDDELSTSEPSTSSRHNSVIQAPLVAKANGNVQYVPWSFMDMVGLASRLPDLNEGVSKWITKLEESTAGVKLALGDIKALLMHVAGKQMTEEVFLDAQLPLVVRGNTADHIGFGGHRNFIWTQLRRHYPEKMDPTKLEGEALNETECPAKFLRDFQRKWKEETGSVWNANNTTQSLFKVMVKKAMPLEVQRRLENVVGLMKMEWPMFSEHVVHFVEQCRKEKLKEETVNKQLANKLTQLQLGELSKQKKDKAKTQAPVMTLTSPHTPDMGRAEIQLSQSTTQVPVSQNHRLVPHPKRNRFG